jgi:hypothetical protein
MERDRPLTSILAVAVTSIVVAIYFGVYFATTERAGVTRYYKSNWQRVLFTPAVKIESLFRREEIRFEDGENPFG